MHRLLHSFRNRHMATRDSLATVMDGIFRKMTASLMAPGKPLLKLVKKRA